MRVGDIPSELHEFGSSVADGSGVSTNQAVYLVLEKKRAGNYMLVTISSTWFTCVVLLAAVFSNIIPHAGHFWVELLGSNTIIGNIEPRIDLGLRHGITLPR